MSLSYNFNSRYISTPIPMEVDTDLTEIGILVLVEAFKGLSLLHKDHDGDIEMPDTLTASENNQMKVEP